MRIIFILLKQGVIYNVISKLWIVAAGRIIVISMNAISYKKHTVNSAE